MPSLRTRASAQDAAYRAHWRTLADREGDDALVWVVLGDSAAVGVGADSVEETYVSQVAARLEAETGRPVRVVNLAVSGATAPTVLAEQIPLLDGLRADAVTCVVGGNDVTWPLRFRAETFAEPLDEIARRVPAGSTLGLVPSFRLWPWESRVLRANDVVREIAARHGLGVADIHTATLRRSLSHQLSRLSRDRFHPNGAGYSDWAGAVYPEVLRQVRERSA